MLLASDGIGDDLLVLEVMALGLDVAHTTHTPANGEIGLLMFPEFDKDDTPDAGGDGLKGTVSSQEQPSTQSQTSWNCQECEV